MAPNAGSAEVAAGVDRWSRGATRGSRCSATTLITPSLRSSRPRIIIAGASRATRRKRAQQPFDTTTLISPVSSSRLRNVVPWAVIGRWRWVTTPATVTRAPGSTSHRPGRRDARRARRAASRRNWSGGRRARRRWPTGRRRPPRPGSCRAAAGPSAPVTTPARRPGRDWATAPTAHSASRRVEAEALAEQPGGGHRLELGQRRAPAPAARGPRGRGTARRPARSASISFGQLVADPAHRPDPQPHRRLRPPSPARTSTRAARARAARGSPWPGRR